MRYVQIKANIRNTLFNDLFLTMLFYDRNKKYFNFDAVFG